MGRGGFFPPSQGHAASSPERSMDLDFGCLCSSYCDRFAKHQKIRTVHVVGQRTTFLS